jgi:hypothetical protein
MVKTKRLAQTRESREANLAELPSVIVAFLETFDPHTHWLPTNTKATDYTPDFCQKLERQYWRNCGLGKPAWYGADTLGLSMSRGKKNSTDIDINRFPIHRRHEVMERGPSAVHFVTPTTRVKQGLAGSEHSLSLFWDVAGNLRLARRRYGSIQY